MTEKVGRPKKEVMDLRDYHELGKKLISQYEKDKQDLEHQILLKQTEFSQLKDSIARLQSQGDSEIREQKRALEQERIKILNELTKREYALDTGERELVRRREDINKMEEQVSGLVEDKKKLAKDRVEVERLFNSARMASAEAIKDKETATRELADATRHKEKAEELNKKTKEIEASLERRSHQLSVDEKEQRVRLENIEKSKIEIAKQLDELSVRENALTERERQISQAEAELREKKIEADKIYLSLNDRDTKLREMEKDLTLREAEFARHKLLSEAK